MSCLAHVRKSDNEEQSVFAHLQGAAEQAQAFAAVFGADDMAKFCGLAHDIGKYSAAFQRRIRGGTNRTDHSTAGAKEAEKLLGGQTGTLLSYCIAGHHGGLPNGGARSDPEGDQTLFSRLQKEVEDYSAFAQEIDLAGALPKSPPPLTFYEGAGFTLSFWVRMLFSCLVDADFLDTERFMRPETQRPGDADIALLEELLARDLQKFANPTSDLNRLRTQILQNCVEKAQRPPGLFTLTVPTGGGKTRSSLAFALAHAKRHGLRRVIYVIPYTSIIEQNAKVFKDILGEGYVLEHHANFDFGDKGDERTAGSLAAENWDMPVIVTTSVQFFESLFGNRTSRCRKLHNIAGSIIIFDEAQMIPLPFLRPCVRAIAELVGNYKCSAVLCTATQPALEPFFPKALPAAEEICGDPTALYDAFKKTRIEMIGALDDEALARRLEELDQVLCIVGTRKQAQSVFALLGEAEGIFHLSTLMCPAHRSAVLEKIRQRLKEKLPCRVISTSLIEAGVDVSFPVVYRALAGVDSLVQAAGRCNREKERDCGMVYVFEPEAKYVQQLPDSVKRPMEVTRSVAQRFGDLAAPEAIRTYFEELYPKENLDRENIVGRLEDGMKRRLSFPFKDISDAFKLIDDNTHAVIIPRDAEARAMIKQLQNGTRTRDLLRGVQRYTVSIYDREYAHLKQCGAVQALDEDEAISVLTDEQQYTQAMGLKLQFIEGKAIIA